MGLTRQQRADDLDHDIDEWEKSVRNLEKILDDLINDEQLAASIEDKQWHGRVKKRIEAVRFAIEHNKKCLDRSKGIRASVDSGSRK